MWNILSWKLLGIIKDAWKYGFKEDYNGKDKGFTVVELNDGAFIIKSNRGDVYEKSWQSVCGEIRKGICWG